MSTRVWGVSPWDLCAVVTWLATWRAWCSVTHWGHIVRVCVTVLLVWHYQYRHALWKKKSNRRRYIRNIKWQRQYSVRLVIQCALSRINAGKYNRIWIFLSYSLWSRCYVKHFFNLRPIRIFGLNDLGWDFASPSQSGSKSLGKWALVRSSQHKNWKREWLFVVRVNSLRLTTLLYNTDWIWTADRYHFSNLSKQNLSNLCFRQAAWRQSLVLLSGPTSRHHTHKNTYINLLSAKSLL